MSQPLSGHLGRKIGLDRDEDLTEDRRPYSVDDPYAADDIDDAPTKGDIIRSVMGLVLIVLGIAAVTGGVWAMVGPAFATAVLGVCLMVLGAALSMG